MKALRRSLSPFRRRKAATDLIQDVRLFEESLVSITPISKTTKSAKRGVQTPDTSHESTEGSHVSTSSAAEPQQPQRPRSRSPFRRRKAASELLDDVRQLETKSLMPSSVRRSPTLRSEPEPWRSSGTVSTASEPPYRPRRRSKSPIAPRKKASDLIEDLRDFERSVKQSSSTVSMRYVPGQSCRTVCSSPNHSMISSSSSTIQKVSPESPSGSRSRFWRFNEDSTGSILAAPWSFNRSKDGCNESGVEQELTPPRYHVESPRPLHIPSAPTAHSKRLPSSPPTPPQLRVPSSPGSVASSSAYGSTAPRSRSKSPYVRRRKVQHVITDMRKIEMDYASRAVSFSECSAVELFLPPSITPESSPARTVSHTVKTTTNVHELTNPASLHISNTGSTIGLQTVATVPLHCFGQRTENPHKRNIVGRKSLLAQDSTVTTKPFDRGHSKSKSVASTASMDPHLSATPDRPVVSRSKTNVGKISVVGSTYPVAARTPSSMPPATSGANAKARYPKDDVKVASEMPSSIAITAPATSISLGRRSHISDLSCPVPDGFAVRHRSMGNDSVAEIQKALSKVQADLQGAHVMGKKVSRVLVMKKLLEVAETIECQEDRLLVQRKLSRLNGTECPGSENSSCSSDLKRSNRPKIRTVTQRILSDDISLSDDDDDDDDDTRDSLSSDSSFSVWLAKQHETKGHWQQILDMMGLSYLWFNDDDLEQEWDDFVDENHTDDEDNIPFPPIVETFPFSILKAKGSMTESHVTRSSTKLGGQTSPKMPTLFARSSQRDIEIAEEEQMLRELEQIDHQIKPSQPKVDKIKGQITGDRLRRLGYEMKKENEEVETKRKVAMYERKAREAAELKTTQLQLASRQKGKAGDGTTSENSRHISQGQVEKVAPGIAKESVLQTTSGRRGGPSLSLNRVPSWHRRRTAGTQKPTVETIAVAKAASTDIEDGALSMGSIESYQFKIQSLSDRRVAIEAEEKDAALEETGWTYTEKSVRRKHRKALEVAAAHHDKRRKDAAVGRKEDEERSDRVKRGRDRSSRPPLNRKT